MSKHDAELRRRMILTERLENSGYVLVLRDDESSGKYDLVNKTISYGETGTGAYTVGIVVLGDATLEQIAAYLDYMGVDE